MKKLTLVILILFTVILNGYTQDCQSPIQVCFDNPVDTISTTEAPPGPQVFCFPADNSVYFSVTTNDIGGDLDITLDSFDCLDSLATGDSLYQGIEAVVYEADESNICNEFLYNELLCSSPSDTSLVLSLTNLSPATTYYVMVDGAEDIVNSLGPGQCQFNIDVIGEAIENEFTAGPDFEIDFGETVVLQPSGFGDSLVWSPVIGLIDSETNPNTTAAPGNTMDYILSTLLDGCYVHDTMTVTVLPTIIPFNAFTPNGDGHNDTWGISLINRYPKADIRVYSRWGQTVFRSIGYTTPWDGTFGGSRLPAATYYYIVRLNDNRFSDEENTIAGSVAIIY